MATGLDPHEQPAGALTAPPDLQHEHGELPEPADTESRGTGEKALDRIEHDARLQALHVLKPREREALYLKGLGYSYHEIMELCWVADVASVQAAVASADDMSSMTINDVAPRA